MSAARCVRIASVLRGGYGQYSRSKQLCRIALMICVLGSLFAGFVPCGERSPHGTGPASYSLALMRLPELFGRGDARLVCAGVVPFPSRVARTS